MFVPEIPNWEPIHAEAWTTGAVHWEGCWIETFLESIPPGSLRCLVEWTRLALVGHARRTPWTRLGVDLHCDAYIFRAAQGLPIRATRWATEFRDVRTAEFGGLERRTIGHDFHRTGAVEAIVGGANSEQVAHAMGNTLSASNALFATYVPVNVAMLQSVMDARRAGRRKLR